MRNGLRRPGKPRGAMYEAKPPQGVATVTGDAEAGLHGRGPGGNESGG